MAKLTLIAHLLIGGGEKTTTAPKGVDAKKRLGSETPKPARTTAATPVASKKNGRPRPEARRHGAKEENRSFTRRGGDQNPITTLQKSSSRLSAYTWLGQEHQLYCSADVKGVKQYLKLLPFAPPVLEEDPFPQLVLDLHQHRLEAFLLDGTKYFTARFQRDSLTKHLILVSFKQYGNNGNMVKTKKDPTKKDPVRDEVVNRHKPAPSLGWMGGAGNGSQKGELIEFLLESLNRAQPGFISAPLTYLVFRDREQAALQGFLRNHLVFIASFGEVDNKGGAELIELIALPQSLLLEKQDRRKGRHQRTVDVAQAASEAWCDANALEFLTRSAQEAHGIRCLKAWLDQLDFGAEMAAAIERELKMEVWNTEIRLARLARLDQEYLGWFLCPEEPEHQEILINPDPEEVASFIDLLELRLSDGKHTLACQGSYLVGR